MKLVKKLRLKVNEETQNYLEFSSDKCRILYNSFLYGAIKKYQEEGESFNLYKLKKLLPIIKKNQKEYSRVYNKCLASMCFRLGDAFKLFFRGGNRFPRYKRKNEFVSLEYPGMYIKVIDRHRFVIPTGKYANTLIARTYEEIPKKFKTVSIIKDGKHYYACFIVDINEKKEQRNNGILAIDLGIKNLVTGVSTFKKYISVGKFSYYVKHLDDLRGKRDRCVRGSIRYKKWDIIFRRELCKYKNRVNDYIHKSSTWLCKRKEYTLVIGDLNLNKMKTKKSWFNRIICNEWRIGRFVGMLKYKSKLYGKNLVLIDEAYTTVTCASCGCIVPMSLNDRKFSCLCGYELDRDRNSAFNILKKYISTAGASIKGFNRLFAEAKDLNIDRFVRI